MLPPDVAKTKRRGLVTRISQLVRPKRSTVTREEEDDNVDSSLFTLVNRVPCGTPGILFLEMHPNRQTAIARE